MEAKKTEESSKKKFQRKIAPSKAPRRLLKKKLRDLERLVKNKNSLKDMPDEVIQETEKKIADVKKQIEALGPDTSTETQTLTSDNSKGASSKKSKGLKFTELRRAGRRISAFKKQHPNYETSEEESKALEDLELDILYIKNFPKGEEYISIYPESPLEDEAQVKMQVEIREKIAKARANGELKNLNSKDNSEESPKTVIGKHPASNWSDEEEGSNSDEEEEEIHESKKQKSE
ncbi:hypothetical protein BGZ49_002126 [Haplosporangium sp. Z 27]|nr:hypothetical protein BGZ49_002126 [Haplosporangium sp. Z 27]